MRVRVLCTSVVGAAVLLLAPNHRPPRADASDDYGRSGELLAVPDHTVRDAILNQLKRPWDQQQSPLLWEIEQDRLIRRLVAFPEDRFVIQTLLFNSCWPRQRLAWRPPGAENLAEEDVWRTYPYIYPYCAYVPTWPGRDTLIAMGPQAAPLLVDEFISKPYVDDPDWRNGPHWRVPLTIIEVLSSNKESTRAAIRIARQRMAIEPKNDRVQRACQDLIDQIVNQFPLDEREGLLGPAVPPK